MRFAEFPRCCQSETAVIETVLQNKQHKGARYPFCAPLVDLLKFCCISESNGFRKCIRPGNSHDSNALIVLDGNSLPALVSSRFQHEPAATRLHTFSKSVRFGATAVVRLVCSLWHSYAPSKTLNLTQWPVKSSENRSLNCANGSATLSRLSRN